MWAEMNQAQDADASRREQEEAALEEGEDEGDMEEENVYKEGSLFMYRGVLKVRIACACLPLNSSIHACTHVSEPQAPMECAE